jgi:hypothetical protein
MLTHGIIVQVDSEIPVLMSGLRGSRGMGCRTDRYQDGKEIHPKKGRFHGDRLLGGLGMKELVLRM